MKQLKFVVLFLSFSICVAFDSPCGDWEPYKDEKCFKILTKAGLQTFAGAESSCKQEDVSSHLISITFGEEQQFLTNFLFNKSKVVDNVWIGAKYTDAHKFQWEDGAEVTFTNWAPGRPKNLADYCVQIDADVGSLGKWVDEPCQRKNVVVCQKKQTLPLARIQEILFEVKKNPVPIGFIYVQLPKEKSPQDIWPWMTWTDVSATYAGVFFRVEGGGSAAFGQIQEDNAPRLTDVHSYYITSELGIKDKPNEFDWHHAIIPKGGTSKWIHTGSMGTQERMTNFQASGGEVRPRNMAMRVWKRTG